MKRVLAISLLILCTLAAMLPIADSLAGGPQNPAAVHHRRRRRHSRAWWRRHRRLMRQRRAAAARRTRLSTLAAQGRLPVTQSDALAAQAVTPAAHVSPATRAAEAHALLTPALPPLALPAFGANA